MCVNVWLLLLLWWWWYRIGIQLPARAALLAVADPVFRFVRALNQVGWFINQLIQYQSNMGHTKQSQKITRAELDEKLSLSIPSRELLEELAVACAEDPTPDKTFQYAFCLSKSRQESELRYAVTILDSLVKEGYEHQIDCMIGSATALYLLGDFEEGQ